VTPRALADWVGCVLVAALAAAAVAAVRILSRDADPPDE